MSPRPTRLRRDLPRELDQADDANAAAAQVLLHELESTVSLDPALEAGAEAPEAGS